MSFRISEALRLTLTLAQARDRVDPLTLSVAWTADCGREKAPSSGTAYKTQVFIKLTNPQMEICEIKGALHFLLSILTGFIKGSSVKETDEVHCPHWT